MKDPSCTPPSCCSAIHSRACLFMLKCWSKNLTPHDVILLSRRTLNETDLNFSTTETHAGWKLFLRCVQEAPWWVLIRLLLCVVAALLSGSSNGIVFRSKCRVSALVGERGMFTAGFPSSGSLWQSASLVRLSFVLEKTLKHFLLTDSKDCSMWRVFYKIHGCAHHFAHFLWDMDEVMEAANSCKVTFYIYGRSPCLKGAVFYEF